MKRLQILPVFRRLRTASPGGGSKSLKTGAIQRQGQGKSPWKKRKIGPEGGDPTFSAFAAQKVSWAPALGHDASCRGFFHGDDNFGRNTNHKEKHNAHR